MKEALAEVGEFKIGGRIINKVRFADDTAIIGKTLRFADDTAIIAKTQGKLQDMAKRVFDTGRKYGMEINIEKITSNEEIQDCRFK